LRENDQLKLNII